MTNKKTYIKDKHPILDKEFIDTYLKGDVGQIFSVEASLDSFIPWINYVDTLVNKKVLVFGTGCGGTVVACALNIERGKVYGVDISKSAIETTTKRAILYKVANKIELFHMESTFPLNFNNEYFDIVIMADVLEHIVDDRSKYVKNVFSKLKKGGLLIITGTPNVLYPKDLHTTGLLFVPWMTSKFAYNYAIFRGRWKKGDNLDYAGRKGTTYWKILNWLKEFEYEVLNLNGSFTSEYLLNNGRINSKKRKLLFKPYEIIEKFLAKYLKTPVTAIMPYLNHLFIKKL